MSEGRNKEKCPKCRCKEDPPRKHGPYYQLSYTRKDKSRSRFIQKEDVAMIKKELVNYAKFKKYVEELIGLRLEQSEVRMNGLRSGRIVAKKAAQ